MRIRQVTRVDVWDNLGLTARKLVILKTERCPSG
jgi:hypothetical protein